MLRPGGVLYLSTAPFLSLAGAHLPRLLVPVPLHLLLGRRLAFRALLLRWRATRPGRCRSGRRPTPSSRWPSEGKQKQDDLLSG